MAGNKKLTAYLSQKEYNFIYHRVPRLCVDAVIQDRRGIVLFKRDIPPFKGMWNLPGGAVHHHEALERAVLRICLEETGLKIRVRRIIGVMEYFRESGWRHSVSIVFLVRPISGALRGSVQSRGIRFFRYIPKNLFPKIIPAVRKFLTANCGKLGTKIET